MSGFGWWNATRPNRSPRGRSVSDRAATDLGDERGDLVERYGIDDPRTLAFFTVHSTLDVEHSGAEREMIAALAPTPADEEAVLASTRAALDAWWGFLDAVNV